MKAGIVRSLHFPKGAQPALLAPPPSNLLEIYSAALRDAALINEKLQELLASTDRHGDLQVTLSAARRLEAAFGK